LLFVPLHGEGTDHNDWDRCKAGCRVIAVEHGQLNIHEHEIVPLSLGDALGASHGLDHGVVGGGMEVAQDSAQMLLGPRRRKCVGSSWTGGGCGAYGQLHAERRALTQRRLDPNAPAVHLHDLSRNGETEPRAALDASVRAVNLMEQLEDAGPLVLWNA